MDGCQEIFLPLGSPNAAILREAGVILAGVSDLSPSYLINRPRCPFHAALFVTGGTGYCRVAEEKIELSARRLLLRPAKSDHHYHSSGASWRMVWFHLEDNERWGHLRDFQVGPRVSHAGPNLEHAMRQLIYETISGAPNSDRIAKLQAEIILRHLDRELNSEASPAVKELDGRLDRLRDRVNAHPRRPWTVAELAREMNLSVPHFSRICRQRLGLSPMRMVTRLRMELARELLRDSPWTVYQVAEHVGYQNPFAFSAAFKRDTGQNPREFREKR